TLQLGGDHKLAFGMKGGATFHKVALFSEVFNNVPDANDPAFSENTSNTFLNIGAGMFYYTNKYYLGVSVPNMLKSKHLDFNGREFGSEVSHYFVTGGYVFDINQNVKLKPFAMVKSAFNAPTSIDASLNTLLYEKLELG
ncbi:PorP/SprF family type IX secretion system membrane protein, partial [Flavobacterium enshiense]|uniref:PorP/SprF family type IX secretion system membrane protein n=1 Tax=Flavobacterium enshiense TaxID=1341165 RepID=UPI00345D7810